MGRSSVSGSGIAPGGDHSANLPVGKGYVARGLRSRDRAPVFDTAGPLRAPGQAKNRAGAGIFPSSLPWPETARVDAVHLRKHASTSYPAQRPVRLRDPIPGEYLSDFEVEVYLTLSSASNTVTPSTDPSHFDWVVKGFRGTEIIHDVVPVDVEEEIVVVRVTLVPKAPMVQEQPRKIGMKPLLFHVKGREWRCRPSFLSSEAAFRRIQGGSTSRANGQSFTRHGTFWKAGEEMGTPGG